MLKADLEESLYNEGRVREEILCLQEKINSNLNFINLLK
jgi:hypothetical protein